MGDAESPDESSDEEEERIERKKKPDTSKRYSPPPHRKEEEKSAEKVKPAVKRTIPKKGMICLYFCWGVLSKSFLLISCYLYDFHTLNVFANFEDPGSLKFISRLIFLVLSNVSKFFFKATSNI